MAKPRQHSLSSTSAAQAGVEALLSSLRHPQERVIRAVRTLILDADSGISESVKWKAPSFATTEHFATFHLRACDGVQVVLHLGAKSREECGIRKGITDPAGLLEWRGTDRATVFFRDLADVEAKAQSFVAILRQWIIFVD